MGPGSTFDRASKRPTEQYPPREDGTDGPPRPAGHVPTAFLLADVDLQADAPGLDALRTAGFDRVVPVRNGVELGWQLSQAPFSVVVLDMQPQDRSLAVVDHLSGFEQVRILMAVRPGPSAVRAQAYQRGADVCLEMPLDADELAAAARQCARRATGWVRSPVWSFDARRSHVRSPCGIDIDLTTLESRFVALLVDARGATLSRAAIESALWGHSDIATARRLEVLCSRLRSKIGVRTGEDLLRTVHRTGYTLNVAVNIVAR